MKRLSFLFLILPLLCCSNLKQTAEPNKCVCILLDLSLSTQTEKIRDSYIRDIKKITQNIQPGDAFITALITGNSISELEFCVQHVFDHFEPGTDNELRKKALWVQFEKQQKVQKDSLVAVIDSTLHENRKIQKTEIMGALDVAARTFRNYRYNKNILVLFSDMLEDSQFYRFDHENLSPQRIHSIIETETSNQRMPDLKDVKIYVTGAQNSDRKRFLTVRDFWLGYFQQAGAQLSPDNYGSILIRFDD